MPLRRLTRFSKLELEKEKGELERTIEQLDAILADEKLLRKVVSDELTDVAKEHGTPRRTVLLGAAPAVTAASAVEVSRRPLLRPAVLHRPARPHPGRPGPRTRRRPGQPRRDGLRGPDDQARRGRPAHQPRPAGPAAGASTSAPSSPRPPTTPTSPGGVPLSEIVALEAGERPLALTSLRDRRPRPRARHPRRRRQAGQPGGAQPRRVGGHRPQGRRRGRRRRRARHGRGGALLHLHRRAAAPLPGRPASVRRAAPAAAWPASSSAPASGSAFFGAFDPADAVVVTASGSSTALPGTEAGAVKVTPFTEYPGKGRATGGVRSHRFLKGEDTLVTAWAGPGPARAAASSGAPIDLPEADGRRDGSGVPAPQPIAAVASPVAAQVATRAASGARTPVTQPSLWKAERHARSRPHVRRGSPPTSPPSSSPCPPSSACSGDDGGSGGDGDKGPTPEEVLAEAATTAHRDERRRPQPVDPVAARRRLRHRQRDRHDHPGAGLRRVDHGRVRRPDRRRARHRRRRQRLRPAPLHPGLGQGQPQGVRRPRPRRTLVGADGFAGLLDAHRVARRPARACAAAPTTPRSSRPTPAPCPGRRDGRGHPVVVGRLLRRRVAGQRRRRAAQGHDDRRLLPPHRRR